MQVYLIKFIYFIYFQLKLRNNNLLETLNKA